MMKFRFFGWMIALIVLATATESCTPTQKATKSVKAEKTPEKAGIRPSWYEESRGQTDTLSSSGYGMAVSMDSAKSVRRAAEQAGIRLKNAVGDSLEKLRRHSLESSASGSTLDNASFIIKLRNATADLEEQAAVQKVEVKRKRERWIAFVRAELSWKKVSEHLNAVLSDYPLFLEAL